MPLNSTRNQAKYYDNFSDKKHRVGSHLFDNLPLFQIGREFLMMCWIRCRVELWMKLRGLTELCMMWRVSLRRLLRGSRKGFCRQYYRSGIKWMTMAFCLKKQLIIAICFLILNEVLMCRKMRNWLTVEKEWGV